MGDVAAFHDVRCPDCGWRIGWFGTEAERPACPNCVARPGPGFTFHHGELETPGRWKGWLVSCPRCGGVISLTRFEIDHTGFVMPSLVCPHAGCAFHEFVRLRAWVPRAKPKEEVRRG